jgi:hypothetical protein
MNSASSLPRNNLLSGAFPPHVYRVDKVQADFEPYDSRGDKRCFVDDILATPVAEGKQHKLELKPSQGTQADELTFIEAQRARVTEAQLAQHIKDPVLLRKCLDSLTQPAKQFETRTRRFLCTMLADAENEAEEKLAAAVAVAVAPASGVAASDAAGADAAASGAAASGLALKKRKRITYVLTEDDDDEDKEISSADTDKCINCCTNKREGIFLPCRHVAYCNECAFKGQMLQIEKGGSERLICPYCSKSPDDSHMGYFTFFQP